MLICDDRRPWEIFYQINFGHASLLTLITIVCILHFRVSKKKYFLKNKKKCVKGFGGFSEFLASSLPNSEKNAINLFRKHFSHKSLFVISFDYIVPIIALS